MMHETDRRAAVGVALVACALSVLWATGCESRNLRPIRDEADFRTLISSSDKPVLVDFHKGGGCPPCIMLLPILDKLADEYQGRVVFTHYEIITQFFQVTAEDVKKEYDIFYIPTVILFVHGKEYKRWPLVFLLDEYRKVLDEVLAAQAAKELKAAPLPAHS
jgi:thiol-disulfide isomerase/thioredoxin